MAAQLDAQVAAVAGRAEGRHSVPLIDVSDSDGCRGANPFNAVDYSPLLRAALVNLDRWVTAGDEPPRSAFPRLADGTTVRPTNVLEFYRSIPGAHVPAIDRLPVMRRVDLGPEAAQGVGRYPAELGEPYRTYVSAVDADGNEIAGIRLPDLTVPLATYTGWNPRHHETGGTGQLIPMQGSTFPLPATKWGREQTADARPSVEERFLFSRLDYSYGRDRERHLEKVRAVADELVSRRHLLAEDVELAVQLAGERFDAFAR